MDGRAMLPAWARPESVSGVMQSVFKSLALALALTGVCAGHSLAGDNWARDLVRKREAAVFARAGGPILNGGSGDGIRPLVVGGVTSPPNRWPFQAGLLVGSITDNFQAQFCAGTIIDAEFILTAAHCAEVLSAAELHVLTGTQSLGSGGTRHTVKRIKIHPGFNDRTFDFDVALIQLKTKVTGLVPAQMASMITREQEPRMAPDGTNSIVVGWGDTGTFFPKALREVSVPIVPYQRCNSDKSYDGAITHRMLCAGLRRGGKDSCQGDSGGPLVVMDGAGRLRKQAGIVSWGNGCALPDFYGVYSRVAVLQPWVTANMAAMRGAAASALACAISGGRPASPVCRSAAKDEAEQEIAASLDVIRSMGTPAQARQAAEEQRRWLDSLQGICAFQVVAMTGQLGRADCLANETRKRADVLARQLSELVN